MKSIYLGLAIHNHQPLDNLPHVFERAYQQAYLPMLEALEAHPAVRLALHYSGCLLEWLEGNHPHFLQRLARLHQRGQVEIMTGGYYEPILPIIPDADKLGQIAKLTSAIEDVFGSSPGGLWLAERVWEPQLPKVLASAGIEWTAVDDNHFSMVGLSGDDLHGYYITEDEGCPLRIFASSKQLRYAIPWLEVAEVISYLRSIAAEGGERIVVMGDDGEKFGLWPGTYRHCWQNGWMEQFFSALEENGSWLKTVPPGEYARTHAPLGMVYLPTASYAEMQEWSLPPASSRQFGQIVKQLEEGGREEILRYTHAGFWRYFLAKYPEVNWMHKKMLRVHHKVYRADAGKDELWRGQCNCPYWHGVFGGVYLNHIRQAVYRHLLAAERAADEVLHRQQPWLEWEMCDLDSDTADELLVEGQLQNIYLDTSEGGAIVEWDLRQAGRNLGAVMTRRPEAYHQELTDEEREQEESLARATDEKVKTIHETLRVKQRGLEHHLYYDRYRRASLLDHFLDGGVAIDHFIRCDYEEGGDFVDKPYVPSAEQEGDRLTVRLRRDGRVRLDGRSLPLRLEKELAVDAGQEGMQIDYRLANMGDSPLRAVFACEWNLSLSQAGHERHCYHIASGKRQRLSSVQAVSGVERVCIEDPELELTLWLTAERPARLWRFPIETVTNSEDGFELTYQGSCMLLGWQIELGPGEGWEAGLRWQISSPGGVLGADHAL